MTIKNTENMIIKSLNNVVVQFIHGTYNIFINNEIFTILNISTYFYFTIS